MQLPKITMINTIASIAKTVTIGLPLVPLWAVAGCGAVGMSKRQRVRRPVDPQKARDLHSEELLATKC